MCLARIAHLHDERIDVSYLETLMSKRRQDPIYYTPFVLRTPRASFQEVQDTTRILVEKGLSDPMIGMRRESVRNKIGLTRDEPSVFHSWYGPTDTFRWLLKQDHVPVDIKVSDDSGASVLDHHAFNVNQNGAKVILDLFMDESCISEVISARCKRGKTVLHGLVLSLSHSSAMMTPTRLRQTFWYTLIPKLLQAGCDPHVQGDHGETPLDILLKYSPPCWHPDCLEDITEVEDSGSVYSRTESSSEEHFVDDHRDDRSLDCEIRSIDRSNDEVLSDERRSDEISDDIQMSHRSLDDHLNTEPRHILMRWWLNALEAAGIDLFQYGRKEQSLHPDRTEIYHVHPGYLDPMIDNIDYIHHYYTSLYFLYDVSESKLLDISWYDTYLFEEVSNIVPGSWID